jgi:carbonic anhydrase
MKFFVRTFYLLVPLLFAAPSLHAAEAHWTYDGDHGPTHWGEFGSELCTQGAQQSPINIETKEVRPLKDHASDLKINYGTSPVKLINNGHTLQGNVTDQETVVFKNDEYRLVQFHFHTPSEHQVNHKPYPMEMHLVNQDKDGRLLVIGLLIKEGKKNKELATLWSQLPETKDAQVNLNAQDAPNLGALVPSTGHHVFYKGSLTTPPCTEGVQWVVFEQPIELSRAQIHTFQKLLPDNHRPPQPAHEREVDED